MKDRPYDMDETTWRVITKLRPNIRDRVIERAAILIFQAGLTPAEADRRALAEEVDAK